MHDSAPGGHRYKQLDSLRGLAALTVFIGHSIGSIVNTSLLARVETTPLSILFNGYAAVMFFFVLSGFVLSLPFINTEKPLSLTAFYTKRFFRIYPAFIATIILAIILKQWVYDKHNMAGSVLWFKQYWAWDWTSNNFKEILRTLLLIGPNVKTQLIDPPVWSLAAEMKMSLILPFFIWIVSRCGAIVNIGLFLLISFLAYQHTGLQISIFYLGVILAKYHHYLKNKIENWPKIVPIVMILFSLFLYNTGLEFIGMHLKPYYIIFSNYLPAIGSCMFIVILLASKRLSSLLQGKVFMFLGAISYSFYLIHFPMLITVFSVIGSEFMFSMQLAAGLTFLLTITIGYFMTVYIERPFQRIASRLVKKYHIFNTCNIKATGGLKTV